jgi:hypothetical protein
MSPRLPGTASRRTVPAAASSLTAGLVHGLPTSARVLGSHRFGVYLELGSGQVLPVLARDAVALPPALRLAAAAGHVDWGVGAGDLVEVGAGAVHLPHLDVRAVRSWRPPRVRIPVPVAVTTDIPEVDAVRRLLVEAARPTSAHLLDPVRAAVSSADPLEPVRALVGRGAGLTPSGDDALAGALLLLVATGHPSAARLHVAVRARRASTTAVSAALLEAAATGHAAPEVVALVDAVTTSSPDEVAGALGAVLAIGHTSGRDLVAGLAATLEVLASSGRIAA